MALAIFGLVGVIGMALLMLVLNTTEKTIPHAQGSFSANAREVRVVPAAHASVVPFQFTPRRGALADTPASAHDTLRIAVVNVGQGDGIFLQAPDGTTALIDGGYDNGALLAYLHAHGIARIDMLIASHPHADHIGGLTSVLETMPVGAVWTSGASHSTGMFERFIDAIDAAKVPYNEVQTGDTIPFGALGFHVLRSDPNAHDLNDTSLVLRLTYGTTSILFTGDAEKRSERELIEQYGTSLASTILKVGHHGSYTSSSHEFLELVQPAVAIYSAGRSNSYGHPHNSTITNLCRSGASIYGTDTVGTVTVVITASDYTIMTEHEPKKGYC